MIIRELRAVSCELSVASWFLLCKLQVESCTGGGSSIVKIPGDVPPARVYFFGLLV